MSFSRIAAALLALAACAPGAGAQTTRRVLAGSDDGVWLLEFDSRGSTFDIALRPADEDWQWLHREMTGRPALAAAGGDRLHVFFDDPFGHLLCDATGTDPWLAPPSGNPRWPGDAAPLAVAESLDANGRPDYGVLAVVPLAPPTPATRTAPAPSTTVPAATAPAIALTTAPARPAGKLALFRHAGATWEHVADCPELPRGPGTRLLLADTGRAVYLASSDAGERGNRIFRWDASGWQRLDLIGSPASAPIRGLVGIGGQLVVVLSHPSDANEAGDELLLAVYDDRQRVFAIQPARRGDAVATWPADAPPSVARFGKQVAMLWQADGAVRFATCMPRVGQLVDKGPVAFDAPVGDDGEELLNLFMWALLIAVLIPMIALRPRTRPEPFSLPEAARTGPLLKRLIAFLIDLAPVVVLVSFVYSVSPWAMPEEEMRRLYDRLRRGDEVRIPVAMAASYVAMLVLFVAYCTVAEIRYGKTPGKRLMKLRVVGHKGAAPTPRACLLRNLLKVMELVALRAPLLLVLVLLIPLFTRYRQRFGDLVGRTAVVDARFEFPEPDEGQEGQADAGDATDTADDEPR